MEIEIELPQEFVDRYNLCLNHPDAWDKVSMKEFIEDSIERALLEYEEELERRLWFFTEKNLPMQ